MLCAKGICDISLYQNYHVFDRFIHPFSYQTFLKQTLLEASSKGHWCSTNPWSTNVIVWSSYQIRKMGCACPGNAGNVFPATDFKRKPLGSDPGMHHGTCVTHVPWCMSGSLTRSGGENVPGILRACAARNFTYLARGPWRSSPVCQSDRYWVP